MVLSQKLWRISIVGWTSTGEGVLVDTETSTKRPTRIELNFYVDSMKDKLNGDWEYYTVEYVPFYDIKYKAIQRA